ncbi:hypothetical protein DFH07DRAFT_1061802 [Mycena maculata]|uniref:Uncharacterized protein n=1 Tax=Mycena maculata TaxID=230809 RepID=A0AAD7N8W8_9AGAR|nr:hypothetical protein DFH07DRAFT_1061802 [Mycena maculata]
MKFTVALFFSFVAAVVSTPTANPGKSALSARTPTAPGCNFVLHCGGVGGCDDGPCVAAGYSCDGTTVVGSGDSACSACTCELFCGVGPVC